MSAPTAPRSIPVMVTLVHAPACHFCQDAIDALAELERELPVRVELVEATGAVGQALVREHRAPMFPLVLLDGGFFSYGRLSSRKLRKALLTRLSAVA